jgi:two-component system NarL family response regulator
MPCAVLIVDDHPIVPQALAAVIEESFPDVRALQASSLRQARAIYQVEPELVACILDLRLPDNGGLEGLVTLRALRPEVGVVVFTGLESDALRRNALELGASAMVSKSESTDVLLNALDGLMPKADATAEDGDGAPVSNHSGVILSPRQQQIWQAIADGMSNQEIAQRYRISLNTTKAHVRELLQRLGVRNRTEAATLYMRRGRSRSD